MSDLKIFAKTIEPEAQEQVRQMAESKAYRDCKIRIMPDCHAGKGCTVGTVIETRGKVVPNTVGVDIGCGMCVVDLGFADIDLPLLDFHSVIVTQVVQGKSPVLLQNYGRDWFNTNLYNYFCNLVRDHISQYSPFDLMSNRQVLSTIDKKILKQMQDYVAALSKHKPMPVIIKDVIIGKATPNKEQLAEMNRTAKMVQAKQTQEREYEVQVAREKAERQKAVADKAYMSEMNLSPQQFIQLKWVETVAQKQGANIDVLVGPAEHMWNIKR